MEALGQYYYIDIIAMLFTFFGIYLLGNKVRTGFVISSIGNVGWLMLGIITQSYGLIIANCIVIMLQIRGYFKWKLG